MKLRVTRGHCSAYLTIIALMTTMLLGSCRDDLLYDLDNGEYDGTLSMTLSFQPMFGVETNTRAAGNSIKNINSLAVVIYNNDGSLYKVIRQGDAEMTNLNINQTGNTQAGNYRPADTPADADQAEKQTPKATFSLQGIPFGKYRMYAVANMTVTDDMVASEVTLKSTLLTWNEKDVTANAQMFGYFTQNGEETQPSDFEAPLVTVGKGKSQYHAWVRRAASKVTIAFDAHKLKQDVFIYINKVTIRDIPKYCTLGRNNSPQSNDSLISVGGVLYYNNNGEYTPAAGSKPSSNYNDWLVLTNNNTTLVGSHSENAPALFFYENMQGNYPGEAKYDKRQDKNHLGILVDPGDPDYKDNVEYGTWVEVEAYYDSRNPLNVSQGKIIYRFMLGKDITYNYNAQRNHHYKLTLSFNGWANQADWHIEYTAEDPGIQTPPVFYVPYLYNQQTQFPIKLNGNAQSLKVEIIENGWAPINQNNDNVPSTSDYLWNKPAYDKFGPKNYYYLGFLALTVPNETGDPAKTIGGQYDYSAQATATNYIKGLYDKTYTATGGYKWSQKSRELNVKPGLHQKGNNQYTVVEADQGEAVSVLIPLWTRNKTIIPNTGYSGNNPYDCFRRKAVVRITATFKLTDGTMKTLSKDVTVYQVPRIVNPKGVWRSDKLNDKDKDFDVHLMSIKTPNATQFSPIKSQGSWKAYIEHGDKTFCKLTDASGTEMDTIEGLTLSEVRFKIHFNGSITAGTTKGCVVRVNYDGGSCVHKILVRQGYNTPVKIKGDAQWSSYSLYTCEGGKNNQSTSTVNAVVTSNPLALGSFFKRRNYSDAILIKNNNKYGPLDPIEGGSFEVGQKDKNGNWVKKTWGEISAYHTENNNTVYKWAPFYVPAKGRTYKVPSYDDYKALDDAEYAFGVVYADGATQTATSFDEAYGFQDANNNTTRSTKGVRGIIVYDNTTGNQILFPLGKNGMGRRTEFNVQWTPASNYYGFLRYSDVSNVLSSTGDLWRPVPYNLPRVAGAIYWIDLPKAGGHEAGGYSMGWDMNYFSFGFSAYTANNRYDACPIKLIVNK